jgi:hypothetical protein
MVLLNINVKLPQDWTSRTGSRVPENRTIMDYTGEEGVKNPMFYWTSFMDSPQYV